MRRSTALLLLGGIVAGGIFLWLYLGRGPESNALRLRAMATRALAEALVKTRAGRRALVVTNPFASRQGVDRSIPAMEAAGLRGLKEGFGGAVVLEQPAFPELKPEAQSNPRAVAIDPESTTPLSYLMSDQAIDGLVERHPQCDLIVSLVGLPAALDRVQCWQTPGPPRFGLLLPDLRLLGNAAAIRNAVKNGKLAAFVLARPDAPGAEKLGSDSAAEIEKRFLVVTVENIDQVMQAHPRLFPGQ